MPMYPFLPHTKDEVKEMLNVIGVEKVDDLYSDVTNLYNDDLDIPESMSEIELNQHLKDLAANNKHIREYGNFRGAGIYSHYIPSLVYQIGAKRGFLTAYTPYQAEVSQGTLQIMYEFQTMMCELTGMEVANASMYDGATSMAEAILMASRVNKKYKTLIADSIHPEYKNVSETYIKPQKTDIEYIKYDNKTGMLNLEDLKDKLDENTSSVVIGYPNFFGIIEHIDEIKEILPEKVMLIVVANPIALGMLESPGKLGADIVVGEGQPLGNAPAMGGPNFGFFTSKKKYIRQMPGRIIGETVDEQGKPGYVMVLQTREQHIRRDKSTSNICSNHAHNALLATIYLNVIGKRGLKEIAYQNYYKAHYLAKKLLETEKFEPMFEGDFFNEFTIKYNGNLKILNNKLLDQNYFGPYDLEKNYSKYKNIALFCATELTSKEDVLFLTAFVEGLI